MQAEQRMQRSAGRPAGIGEHARAPGVEQHEVEPLRPVARADARPERGVRVHALAGRRARQQLEEHLEVAEARDRLLDPHHRDEHLGQRRAHPAVALGLDDADRAGVGGGEVRARDRHARPEERLAEMEPRRLGELARVVGEVRAAETRRETGRGSRSGSCGSPARAGATAALARAGRSARPGRSRSAGCPPPRAPR